MKNLFLGLSLAAMALLAACSSGSGTNSEPLEISSNSSSESVDEYDGSSSSEETDEGKSSASEEPESSGSEGVEGSDGSSSSDEGKSSSSEEPESSSEEASSSSEEQGSSSSEDVESSGSGEGSSASVPGGSSDASVYDADKNTLKDLRDGLVYKTTTIDIPSKNYSEVWMAENLNFVTDNSWCGGGSGTTEGDCSVYGRLYTWAAAVGMDEDECGYGYTCGLGSGDIRGACPKGWHLPSYDEWDALFTAVGGSSTAGTKLKSATGWAWDDDISGNGTDTFGFSALPAGSRNISGYYGNEGYSALFRSSSEGSSYIAYNMCLVYSGGDAILDYHYGKDYGFSVRCLKD